MKTNSFIAVVTVLMLPISVQSRFKLSPIVLIPGLANNQINTKLNQTDEYSNVWLNIPLLMQNFDGFENSIKLIYDNSTQTTRSLSGNDIQIPGFGNTSSVEYLNPNKHPFTAYMNKLVSKLVSFGYQRGISIRGAPYDFRKAPKELSLYYKKLKHLIEETYDINNDKKVMLLCHSMGCRTMLYFLNAQPQEWKNKYIKSLISLGGAWGGAVKSLKTIASGDNFGIKFLDALKLRKVQRTFMSMNYLFPSDKLWDGNEVLIQTGLRNYTVNDYKQFFGDINYTEGYHMWLNVRHQMYDMTPPGVEVHCLHGKGVKTMDKLIYTDGGFPDSQPHIVYGDGDGTVNLRSLRYCLKWDGKQAKKVHYKYYSNVEHTAILSDPSVITYIMYQSTSISCNIWCLISSYIRKLTLNY